MKLALSLTLPFAIWRRYMSASAIRLIAICVGLGLLPILAIHYAREPASGPRVSFGGKGGLTGAGSGPTSSGFTVGLSENDPVTRFVESRVGHILYSPYTSDHCRRVLFHNETGALYETDSVPCMQPAPESRTTTAADRLIAVHKTFQK